MTYREFIENKTKEIDDSGFESNRRTYNDNLFDWQRDIVHWALKKGKACIFADCGLGKSLMQLCFADQVYKHTGKNAIILAPLAVANQTKREGQKFGIDVTVCRSQNDVKPGINVTNYEMINHFDIESFSCIVLDESSILKNATGATRTALIKMFEKTPYKLCCTATPAPNDFMEIGNHSEFLGIMKQTEMLSTYFVHDGGDTSHWRLKGHAKQRFFEWIASWACCITKPSDLGYEDAAYVLPELRIHEIKTVTEGDFLFCPPIAKTLAERREARHDSLKQRCIEAKKIAESNIGQTLIWCDYNDESEMLQSIIEDSTEIKGSDKPDFKTKAMIDFSTGEIKTLITKQKIAGFGMNWQNCSTMVFCGLSDSFEGYYQAVRRCWRFGQKNPVDVYIITSDREESVKQNIERKQENARIMTEQLVQYTKDILQSEIRGTIRISESYQAVDEMIIPEWLKEEKQ